MTTHNRDDGAPAGEYVVTVLWHDDSEPVDECESPDPVEHDRLRGRFARRDVSALRATVRPQPNAITLRVDASPAAEAPGE